MTTDVTQTDGGDVCQECFNEAGMVSRGVPARGTCSICHSRDIVYKTTKVEAGLILDRVSSNAYNGLHAREKVVKALCRRYGGGDLDDHVHELKSREASDINNAGVEAQAYYLLNAGGLKWVVETLLKKEANNDKG